MLVIGLTGGIGAGKSSVAKLFAEHGTPIIDTDIVSREITQPSKAAFNSIVEYFGQDILLENGTLNRALLRELIFTDLKQRRWLECLLHPLIRKETERQIKLISAPYCIVVIPLLYEIETYPSIQRILVIDAPEHLQIERAMVRDDMPKAHIESIIKSQANRKERLARANDVITNDKTLTELIPQVDKLHKLYLEIGRQRKEFHGDKHHP